MRILGARIFSKFFGGKNKNFKQMLQQEKEKKNGACVF